MLDGPAGCMARPLPSSSSRPGTDAAPAAPHGGQRAAYPPGNVREIITHLNRGVGPLCYAEVHLLASVLGGKEGSEWLTRCAPRGPREGAQSII